MASSTLSLGPAVRDARTDAQMSVEHAAEALGLSVPTYVSIEDGNRPLKGSELLLLADALGVRASVIVNRPALRSRVLCSIAPNGSPAASAMSEVLLDFLELNDYLTDQGIKQTPTPVPGRYATIAG